MTAVSREVRDRLATLAARLRDEKWLVEYHGGSNFRVTAGSSVADVDLFLAACSPDVVSGLLADLETLAKAALAEHDGATEAAP